MLNPLERERIRWFEAPAVWNKQPCACKAFEPISTRPLRVLRLAGVHLLSKVLEGNKRNRNHTAGFPLKIVLWWAWYRNFQALDDHGLYTGVIAQANAHLAVWIGNATAD